MSTIKVTNITPQSGTTVHLTGSLTISDTLTAREVRTTINSSEILVSGSTKFGDTADDRHQVTGSLLIQGDTTQTGIIDAKGASSKIRFLYSNIGDLPSATDYHGMFAHVHAEGASYFAHDGNWVKLANSSSFATDIATNVTNISSNDTDISALQADSGSFSTRVTTEEANVDALQVDSGSFSTRVTTEEANVDALQVDSGSFSTRVTTEESNVDALQVDSGSFSTRVTTEEANVDALQVDSGSFSTRLTTEESNVDALQVDSGSFSTRVSSNEAAITALDATYATDAQVATAVSSLNAATSSYAASGSFATDIASNASDIVTINATNATTGANTFTGNQVVSSSILLTIQPSVTTPASAATGSLIISGSPAQLYIFNGSGSGWNKV